MGRHPAFEAAGRLAAGVALLGGAGCALVREQARKATGPTPAEYLPLPDDAKAVSAAAHALNRAAYGPRPGDVARVAQMGVKAYLEEQLADRMEEDPAAEWRVNSLDVKQLATEAPDYLSSMADEQLLTEIQQMALLRAVYSRHQLREVLADFWTNHFNIYALKGGGRALLPTDAETVVRPHILGSFREMLTASARSPAMLAYLDNQENRSGVANENYARELLELHTLGVKSGYTQRDIQEVARCFTGWTVQTGFLQGRYAFDPDVHDDKRKFIPFLNLTLRPGGREKDAERVLHALAEHPKTAEFVATKLCRRFLGHAPPDIVEKAKRAYLNKNHPADIRATLRPILLDALPEPAFHRPLVKRPVEMVVSALRALAADTDGGVNVQRHLATMGQPLYQWPMPDGFPEKPSAWTATLLPRWNFALALASNALHGTLSDLNAPLAALKTRTDTQIVDALTETILARRADSPEIAPVRNRIAAHIAKARAGRVAEPTLLAEAAALLLASPPFQMK